MRKYKLWMQDIVFTEEEMFFSSGQFNGLYRANIQSGDAEFVNFFPHDPKLQVRLHCDAFRYKDEILFLPDLSNYFTLYNIRTTDFECIKFPVDDTDPATEFFPKTVAGILCGSCVYAFGAKYPHIIRYNFDTKQLKIFDAGLETYKQYGYKEGSIFFSRDICQMENAIYIQTYTDNVLVEFNTETERVAFHQIEKQLFHVVCSDNKKIWLLEKTGKNIYFGEKPDVKLENLEITNELAKVQQDYQCSLIFGNKIWLFPFLTGGIMTVDKQSGRSDLKKLIQINKNNPHQSDALGSVWFCKIYNNQLYFMSVLENKLYCYNDNEELAYCMDIYTDRTKLIKQLFPGLKCSALKEEMESLWKVKYDLIDTILIGDCTADKQERPEIEFGKLIYDTLSEQ